MTSPDKNRDKALAEYLSGDSVVSRAYRKQAGDEPSTSVDDAIRAAAKREVHAGPGKIVNPFGRTWTVSASLAAMLLVSVGLVMFLSEETGVNQFSTETLEEKVMEHDSSQPARQDRHKEGKTVSPERAVTSDRGVADQRLTEKEKSPKAVAPAPGMEPEQQPESVGAAGSKQKSRVPSGSAGVQAQPQKKEFTPASRDAARPMMQMRVPVEKADSKLLAPDVWLAQIKTLRTEGKKEQAEASLAAFRRAYPDYPVDSLPK